jgi:hypothetical protein
MKHTPGPWSVANNVHHNRESQRIDGPEGMQIASTMVLSGHDKTSAFYEAHGNAKLIAAAPDLLAALKRLTELVQWHGLVGQANWNKDEVFAAIAKATGSAA